MKKMQIISAIVLMAISVSSCTTTEKTVTIEYVPPQEPEMIVLSGTLQRPVHAPPQLYMGEFGRIRRFDLRGKLLEGIKEDTSIRVKGIVCSKYDEGGTDKDHLAFPAHWDIWLEVKEVNIIEDSSL